MDMLPYLSLFLGLVSWLLVLKSQSINRQLKEHPTQELLDKSQRIVYALYVVMMFLLVAMGFFVYRLVLIVTGA